MNRPALMWFVAAVAAACALAGSSDGTRATPLELGWARAIPHSDVTPTSARAARVATTWLGGEVTAASGERVTVYVSASLPAELGTAQTWAEFLAGLVHGPELPTLTAYIATLTEIQAICGPHALGCYGGGRMASIGETAYGISAEEVVRHEYGHHIAANRVNPPWAALEWGPKHWASQASICRRAAEGTVFPGDEQNNYELNPGEAWAETYRILVERKAGATGSGWQLVDLSFLPDDLALQAAERDVLQPWTGAARSVFRTRFTAKGKRVWSVPITTPLDGDVAITIRLPKGGLHDAFLVDRDRKTTLATGLWAGPSAKRITTTVCGSRSLTLRVSHRGAFGQVVATVAKP